MCMSNEVLLSPSDLINTATKPENIIDILRSNDMTDVADRLTYLYKVIAEDQDEKPIKFETVKGLARFLRCNRQLPTPRIGIHPDGFVHAEWMISNYGILTMTFLPNNTIRFVSILHGENEWRVSDVQPSDVMMNIITPFIEHLTAK